TREALGWARNKGTRVDRPEQRRDLDRVRRYADAVDRAGPAPARSIGDRSGGRDDRSLLRVLDVVHGFLMIVTAQDEIDAHFGEGAKNPLRVLEPMPLRQLAHHRIMMHDDDARIVGARAPEFGACPLELVAPQIADDGDVPQIPGERASRDALRRVESDDSGARDPKDRLRVFA